MRELAARFVPVADEVRRLQESDGPEGALFEAVAAVGHHAGTDNPASTRQGVYALAPGGEFLASTNATTAAGVVRMLERAWVAWEALPDARRSPSSAPPTVPADPEDGLVLRVCLRDLQRGEEERSPDWNLDFAWFRKDEARRFVPESLEPGGWHPIPERLARRLARVHLVDLVRGQTLPFQDRHVEEAVLATKVAEVSGSRVRLHLGGRTRARAQGSWAVGGRSAKPSPQERGFEAKLLGRAVFDLELGRFVEFELLAVGRRWGGTRYNARAEDLGPAPIGVLFELAGPAPGDRVPPALLWSYGW